MTIDRLVPNELATSDFGNELVDATNSNLDFVNGFQTGTVTGTTDSAGKLTATFTVPYASPPAVFAWRESIVSTAPRTCHLDEVTTTTVTVRNFAGSTTQSNDASNTFRWMAFGTLA